MWNNKQNALRYNIVEYNIMKCFVRASQSSVAIRRIPHPNPPTISPKFVHNFLSYPAQKHNLLGRDKLV